MHLVRPSHLIYWRHAPCAEKLETCAIWCAGVENDKGLRGNLLLPGILRKSKNVILHEVHSVLIDSFVHGILGKACGESRLEYDYPYVKVSSRYPRQAYWIHGPPHNTRIRIILLVSLKFLFYILDYLALSTLYLLLHLAFQHASVETIVLHQSQWKDKVYVTFISKGRGKSCAPVRIVLSLCSIYFLARTPPWWSHQMIMDRWLQLRHGSAWWLLLFQS